MLRIFVADAALEVRGDEVPRGLKVVSLHLKREEARMKYDEKGLLSVSHLARSIFKGVCPKTAANEEQGRPS